MMKIGTLQHSPLTKAMDIASHAMHAQHKRLFILSQNLSNVGIRVSPESSVYKRQIPVFKSEFDSKSGTKVINYKGTAKDNKPPQIIYDPDHPMADKRGNVVEANVKASIELADMGEASRSHESCLRAFEKILSMINSTTSLLKSN